MDPISIAGLVCAIVSAFTGAASLFKERKARKKEKTENKRAAVALRRSLAVAPPEVQREYDYDFSRLGQRFATGDDIGQSQLATILIDLQSKMIGTLQALLNGGRGSYTSLLGTSDNARLASISALGSQFQRLSQAAPIQGSLHAMTSRSCVLFNDTDQAVLNAECTATTPDGSTIVFFKGNHCKVCFEADTTNVWVQNNFISELLRVPKINLSRMCHFWADTDRGILNADCTGFQDYQEGQTRNEYTFNKGRQCTVFNVDLFDPCYVWVKFEFSDPGWDSSVGYAFEKQYLSPVYPEGYRRAPTSVFIP